MTQPANRETDPERGDGGIQAIPGIVAISCLCLRKFSTCKVYHGRHEQPQHQSTRPPQGESNFGDSSGPLFSLYSKIAEEDDNKMTDRWQKDADGILIFVSDHVAIPTAMYINCNTADRPIFCCRFRATRRVCPGSQAKSTTYLRILSRKHLSNSRQLKRQRTTYIPPFHYRHAAPVLSSEIRHLGEFTLVFEPGDQSYVCPFGDIVTSMVTSIYQTHPAIKMRPGEASTIARIFC